MLSTQGRPRDHSGDQVRRIYLAGPMTGLTWDQANEWRLKVAAELKPHGIECYSPMRWDHRLNSNCIDYAHDIPEILRRDFYDVMQSDLIYADFTVCSSDIVSFGTVSEVAWGYALRKPTVMVAPKSSIYHHPWMLEMADYVRHTMEDGINTVRILLNK